MQREDFHCLPPIARAQAMDRPYRPSRRPLVIALVVTLLLHVVVGTWFLHERQKTRIATAAAQEARAAAPGIVYQYVPPAPRPASAPIVQPMPNTRERETR